MYKTKVSRAIFAAMTIAFSLPSAYVWFTQSITQTSHKHTNKTAVYEKSSKKKSSNPQPLL